MLQRRLLNVTPLSASKHKIGTRSLCSHSLVLKSHYGFNFYPVKVANLKSVRSFSSTDPDLPRRLVPNVSTNLPVTHQLFSQEIRRQTSWAKLKYWGTFSLMTLGATAVAELAIEQLAGAQGYGLTFLAATAGTAVFQYLILRFAGTKMLVSSMKGQPVSREDSVNSWLLSTVEDLSKIAGLRVVPQVYIVPSEENNAFAAGLTPESSVVCVTTGIMKTLNRDELTAVLGHEIGHLFNGDANISTHLIAINAGFYAAFRVGYSMLRGGRKDDRARTMIGICLCAIGLATYALGLLYRLAVSRSREFAADACSVAFTGDKHIISALQKIHNHNSNRPQTGVLHLPENRMFSHMYLDDSSYKKKASNMMKPIMKLLSTHPSLEERVSLVQSYDSNYFNALVKGREPLMLPTETGKKLQSPRQNPGSKLKPFDLASILVGKK